ncbi:hypothetical protein JCM3774_000637, partial [Rhodotorula dairenensis]
EEDEEEEEEEEGKDATRPYSYFDRSHRLLSRMVSSSVISKWDNRLVPSRDRSAARCWIDLVLEHAGTVPGFRPPRYAQGKEPIRRRGIGRWVARLCPPTWRAAFKSMRVKLNYNPDYGTAAQRLKVQEFVATSLWRQAGMPSKNFASPRYATTEPVVTEEERLTWICLLDSGALVLEPR